MKTINFPDRLYVEAEDHVIYHELVSKKDTDYLVPFRSLKDVFMLAGAIGWNLEKKAQLSNKKELIFHHYLDDKYDKPLILACYVNYLDDNLEYIDAEQAAMLYQEYANFGIKVLYKEIGSSYNKSQSLVACLSEFTKTIDL